MKIFSFCGCVALHFAVNSAIAAQINSTINSTIEANTVHVELGLLWQLGKSLSVDRAKYFNLASAPWSNDWSPSRISKFTSDLNAHLGRKPTVTQLMSQLRPTPSGYINASALSERCAAHPKLLNGWPKENAEMITMALPNTYYSSFNSTGFVPVNHEAAAEMWSLYLKNCAPSWQSRFICEVINEPTTQIKRCNTTWQEMIELHIAVAQRVHRDFNQSDYFVGGPTEAYPSYDVRNFTLWNNTLQPFIDQAGTSMDFLSVHLYDTYKNAALSVTDPD